MKIRIILNEIKQGIDPQQVEDARNGDPDARANLKKQALRKYGKYLPAEISAIFDEFMKEHNLSDLSQVKGWELVELFRDKLAPIINQDIQKGYIIYSQLFNTYFKHFDEDDKAQFIWETIDPVALRKLPFESKIKSFYRKNMAINAVYASTFSINIDRRYHPLTFDKTLSGYLSEGGGGPSWLKNYVRYMIEDIPKEELKRLPNNEDFKQARSKRFSSGTTYVS